MPNEQQPNGGPQRNRTRAWCFTWNNYPADYRNTLDGIECRYLCFGEEVAPDTGTPHIQGYVYYANVKRFAAVRRDLSNCHITPANGSAEQNRQYCGKTRPEDQEPNAVFFERGNIPISSSDKGELERARYQHAWTLAKVFII